MQTGHLEASYDDFVRTHWAALFRTAYLVSGDRHEAEDVLQSALLRAFENWGRVDKADSPLAYVRRILINELVSQRRTATRRGARRHLVIDVPPATGDLDERVDLWRLVLRLPHRQRAVLVLRYYEDLTEAEIARVLDVSRGTVKSQAADGLRKLTALARVAYPEGPMPKEATP